MSLCPWLAARCSGVSSPRFITLMRAPLMMSMSTTLLLPSLQAQWRGLKPWSSLKHQAKTTKSYGQTLHRCPHVVTRYMSADQDDLCGPVWQQRRFPTDLYLDFSICFLAAHTHVTPALEVNVCVQAGMPTNTCRDTCTALPQSARSQTITYMWPDPSPKWILYIGWPRGVCSAFQPQTLRPGLRTPATN